MTRLRAMPTAALILLMAPLAGCFGGDDEAPPSKVHVIWGTDATAGTVVQTMAPNSQNTTQDVVEAEFTFDFNE